MKKFKNNFGVKGSLPLLTALREEVEKLGWKYDNDFNPWGKNPDLYFNADNETGSMKTQHFSSSFVGDCTIYNLPQQWDECLKAASELEEEIPEYVEFISNNFSYFTKGTIYPLNKKGECRTDNEAYYWSIQYPKDKKHMLPSTKKAYEKQQEEFKMKELLKEAKRKYPVGTRFICKSLGEERIVKDTSYGDTNYDTESIWFRVDYPISGCVWLKGEWAEIIEPEKEVEPWAIGTYVVVVGRSILGKIGSIHRINRNSCGYNRIGVSNNVICELKEYLKWFPTLQEAEAFSRELLDKEEEFVLPEKWCIKVQPYNYPTEVRVWRRSQKHGGDWVDEGYICGDTGYHTSSIHNFPEGYIQITIEQFNKYVLDKEKETMEIAGYNVKFEEGKVSVGCYEDITLKELKAFKRVIKFADGRGDITVTENSLIDLEGNQILLEEIEELIERLNG